MSNFIHDYGNLPPENLLPKGFILLAADTNKLPYCLRHVSAFKHADDDHYHDSGRFGDYKPQLVGFDPKKELFYLATPLNRNWGAWENRFSLSKRPAVCMTFTAEQQEALRVYAKKLRGSKYNQTRKHLRRMAELCRDGCPRLRAKIIRNRERNDEAYCRTRGPVRFYIAMFRHRWHHWHMGACKPTEQGGRCSHDYYTYSYIYQDREYDSEKRRDRYWWASSKVDHKGDSRKGSSPIKTLKELNEILKQPEVLQGSVRRLGRFDRIDGELCVFLVTHPELYLPDQIQPGFRRGVPYISWGSLVSGEERPRIKSVDVSKSRFRGWKSRVLCSKCNQKIVPRCQCCRICEKIKPAAFEKLPKKRQESVRKLREFSSRTPVLASDFGTLTCSCDPNTRLGPVAQAMRGVDAKGNLLPV